MAFQFCFVLCKMANMPKSDYTHTHMNNRKEEKKYCFAEHFRSKCLCACAYLMAKRYRGRQTGERVQRKGRGKSKSMEIRSQFTTNSLIHSHMRTHENSVVNFASEVSILTVRYALRLFLFFSFRFATQLRCVRKSEMTERSTIEIWL